MSEEQEKQKREAFRRGVADALNGVLRKNGRDGYTRKHEKEAYDRGYLTGHQKRNSFTEGGEDD